MYSILCIYVKTTVSGRRKEYLNAVRLAEIFSKYKIKSHIDA